MSVNTMPWKNDISNDLRIENVAAHQYGKANAKRFEVHHSLMKDYSQVEKISTWSRSHDTMLRKMTKHPRARSQGLITILNVKVYNCTV